MGEQVTVEMPDGNTVNGKVIAVSSVAQSSSNSDNGNNGERERGRERNGQRERECRAPPRSR